MKKFILISLMILLCACGKTVNNSSIKQYLESKYNQEFTYVRDGNDVWSSKTQTKIFSDRNGNELNVVFFKNDVSSLQDNYYSFIYDNEISNLFQNSFTRKYKVFANTKGEYTSKEYNNMNTYLTNVAVISLRVYTANTDYNIVSMKEVIKNIVINNNLNKYVHVIFYQISNEDFNRLENDIQISNYNYSYSFNFNNGVLN